MNCKASLKQNIAYLHLKNSNKDIYCQTYFDYFENASIHASYILYDVNIHF